MYVIRYTDTENIIYITGDDVTKGDKPENFFADFDPSSMEVGWCCDSELPEHFKIDAEGDVRELSLNEFVDKGLIEILPDQKIQDNEIVDKSIEELIDEGLLKLEPNQKLVAGEIVDKTIEEQVNEGIISLDGPFEYVKGNNVCQYTIQEVLDLNVVNNLKDAKTVKNRFFKILEKKIAKKYPSGYEMKITKAYALWVSEGKPENDPREKKFLEMQSYIDAVKTEFSELKHRINELMKKFST